MFIQNLSKNLAIKVMICFSLLIFFNPEVSSGITSFNNSVGIASINNVDINKRVQNINLLILITILTFFISNSLVNFIFINKLRQNDDLNLALKFLKNFSYALLFVFLYLIIGARGSIDNYYEFAKYLIGTIFLVFCYSLTYKIHHIKFKNFRATLFAVGTFVAVFRFFFVKNEDYSSILFIGFVLGVLIINSFLHLLKIKADVDGSVFYQNINLISLLPLFSAILIETINIHTQFGGEALSKRNAILILTVFLFFLIFILSFLKVNLKIVEKYHLGLLLIGFLFLAYGPNYKIITPTNELFESANHGLLVYDFFNYNKVPILESFDAHMFSISIWGILYGVITKDFQNAVFTPYVEYANIITILALYIFLGRLFDKTFVFFLSLFLPISQSIQWSYFYLFDLTFFSIIITMYALSKNSFKIYFLMIFSFAISFFYRLDTAFVSILSSIFLIILYYVKNPFKINELLKAIYSTLFILIAITLFIISYINIDFWSRLVEFKDIVISNQIWGNAELGDSNSIKYKISYLIFPIIGVLISLFSISKFFTTKTKYEETLYLSIFALGSMYLLNLNRSVVRHSVFEDAYGIIFGGVLLLIPLFISSLKLKKKELVFSTSITFIVLSTSMLIGSSEFQSSIFSKMKDKYNNGTYFKNGKSSEPRVDLINFNIYKNDLENLKTIIYEDNTYIDFTNDSLLYAFLNKEKPFYINQSPGLLNGPVSQYKYINQTTNSNFVLESKTCKSIDSVPLQLRYFIVSDYINRNFKPAYTLENYNVWVKNNYELSDNIVLNFREKEIQEYNAGCKTFDLGFVPYLMGKSLDKEKFIEISKLNNSSTLNLSHFNRPKEFQNYLEILTDENTNEEYQIILKSKVNNNLNSSNSVIYNFRNDPEKGPKSKFLIPIGIDYLWYSDKLDEISIKPFDNIKSIKVLGLKSSYENKD